MNSFGRAGMPQSIHTIIVGGGQSGLAVSYFLRQAGREHLILDKSPQPADSWRSQRWDSFTLVTPNSAFRLPGAEYSDSDPHGYMGRAEIIQRFENYIERYQLPVSLGINVEAVRQANNNGKYLVQTSDGDFLAQNVVVANGWFRGGKIPGYSQKIPSSITQVHSDAYRNPQSLPPGAVLVVGSAQSGAQITEELYQAGRKVYLATGGSPRVPRRYRGQDIFDWLYQAGFFNRPIEMFTNLSNRTFVAPQVTGKNGGHTLSLHTFYRDGVTLLGHARDYVDGHLILADDLMENIGKTDQGEKFLLKLIDEYIQKSGLDVPEEEIPVSSDAYLAEGISSLDLQQADINTIIWACGFKYDGSIVKLPILDDYGYPLSTRGVSPYTGLYFMGIPFQTALKSGFIFGVSEDAQYIAEHITQRL